MYTVAIISKDEERKNCLTEYLERYSQNTGEKLQLHAFASYRQIILNFKSHYDVIFIDMEMRGKGVEAAQTIRRYDKNVILIFLAEDDEYAISGISLNAFCYFLKPLDFNTFSEEFDRVISKLQSESRDYFFLRLKGGTVRIALKDLLFVDCKNHTLTFHTYDGEYVRTGVISEIEKRLCTCGFKRCNSGYLINLSKVEMISGCYVIIGENRLKISRPRRKQFLDALSQFQLVIK